MGRPGTVPFRSSALWIEYCARTSAVIAVIASGAFSICWFSFCPTTMMPSSWSGELAPAAPTTGAIRIPPMIHDILWFPVRRIGRSPCCADCSNRHRQLFYSEPSSPVGSIVSLSNRQDNNIDGFVVGIGSSPCIDRRHAVSRYRPIDDPAAHHRQDDGRFPDGLGRH